MGRIAVSAADIRAAGEGGQYVLPAGAVVTPLAQEVARDLGVTLVERATAPGGPAAPVVEPVRPPASAPAGSPSSAVEDRVRAIVASVLGVNVPAPAPAAAPVPSTPHAPRPVLLARADQAPLAPFEHPGPAAGQDVRTADVVTADDGAPMAAGYMTLTRGSFPWTLTYDEVQVVLEGELCIGTPDGDRVGRPGDVLYVPKGSRITFGTPGWAKFVYVTVPANWQEAGR